MYSLRARRVPTYVFPARSANLDLCIPAHAPRLMGASCWNARWDIPVDSIWNASKRNARWHLSRDSCGFMWNPWTAPGPPWRVGLRSRGKLLYTDAKKALREEQINIQNIPCRFFSDMVVFVIPQPNRAPRRPKGSAEPSTS